MAEPALIALCLVSLALFISMCLNVVLCIRQRGTSWKDKCICCQSSHSEGNNFSQVERQYVCDINHRSEQENPHNHHEQQENPIYGNISTDRHDSSEDCYEMMTLKRPRDCKKPLESDLNYASLDLKLAKKRKKHRQMQGQDEHQDQLPDRLSPPASSFLELEVDMDAHLPPRDTVTMESHSSIYLNSQQIAQEAEEMEREWSAKAEKEDTGWDEAHESDKECGRGWNEDYKSEEIKDEGSNSCVQHLEIETSHSFTDHCSFSDDCD